VASRFFSRNFLHSFAPPGNNYTESTISNMKRLKKGAIIYFDSIRMEIDGEEKKLASRVFRISE